MNRIYAAEMANLTYIWKNGTCMALSLLDRNQSTFLTLQSTLFH